MPRRTDLGTFLKAHKVGRVKRTFTPTMHMTDTFPLSLPQLLPIFEAVMPAEGYASLAQFINTKIPPGFPIKIGTYSCLSLCVCLSFLFPFPFVASTWVTSACALAHTYLMAI